MEDRHPRNVRFSHQGFVQEKLGKHASPLTGYHFHISSMMLLTRTPCLFAYILEDKVNVKFQIIIIYRFYIFNAYLAIIQIKFDMKLFYKILSIFWGKGLFSLLLHNPGRITSILAHIRACFFTWGKARGVPDGNEGQSTILTASSLVT